MCYEYKMIDKQKVFEDEVTKVDNLNILLPNGNNVERVVIGRPCAAAVVALTAQQEILMVRQFRVGMNRTYMEIPAGMIDQGETPEQCALRELEEETGYKAGKIKHILTVDPVPAFCNERVYIYIATELSRGSIKLDEDEFLICEKLHIKTLIDMLQSGKINDAKTIIGIFAADRIINGAW